ncbi:MAG: GTP 3',8-cyclase MoaA [Tissierellia bacterium]|nr:GTP 3',8-cyclase MoaA [Tissierellia bacterium]
MLDRFGREINYLRISLTDRCNLRCIYCMPEKGISKKIPHDEILTLEEIYELIKIFVELGIDKIRFTGGEPLVRKNMIQLIKKTSKLQGVKDISLTTNGQLLKEMAQDLKDAGLNRVNISLDTLDPEKFKTITRGGNLNTVLDAIDEAIKVGLTPLKINTVLIGGFNENEISNLIDLTKRGIDVRFIELMPIGEAASFAKDKFISNKLILETMKDLVPVEREDISSPATYYQLPGVPGKVGIINPISCKFCDNCNRIRLTSSGQLKLCLHSNREIDLKSPLRNGEDVKKIITDSIWTKEESHHLEDEEYIDRNMNQIGG